MDGPLFGVSQQLYRKLALSKEEDRLIRWKCDGDDPSRIERERVAPTLPSQPRIPLSDHAEVIRYLQTDLLTPDLDRFAPRLWLMAKQDSRHVSSLTHQRNQGRHLIVTEDPELHLVWMYDQIFLKPIPKYLLSHAFWGFYLARANPFVEETARRAIVRAAKGFLRSYALLIRHKSDFLLARDATANRLLIPDGFGFSDFIYFISAFAGVPNEDVSPRYGFGQLRLRRLNACFKIFMRRLTFRRVGGYTQYSTYFTVFYGPLLLVFGFFSVALSAMQVALAVLPLNNLRSSLWSDFAQTSQRFAVFVLVAVTLIALFLLIDLMLRAGRNLHLHSKTW